MVEEGCDGCMAKLIQLEERILGWLVLDREEVSNWDLRDERDREIEEVTSQINHLEKDHKKK